MNYQCIFNPDVKFHPIDKRLFTFTSWFKIMKFQFTLLGHRRWICTELMKRKTNLLLGSRYLPFKDIVQPKKRGVRRVTNRFALPSYTIADIFFGHLMGYSCVFNLKKPVLAFRAKKCGVFLMWSPLPKTQRRIKTLRHSPCNDTPNAAIVAVTTCGVSL